MNHKNTIFLLKTAGVIGIGLLGFGLLTTEAATPLLSAGSQKSTNNSDIWAAALISKETLLLLLAVGIAGVLGMSRKKKNVKNQVTGAESNRSSDP